MLSVTHFYREPRKTGVSIEGIFKLVKESLINEVEIKDFYCDPGLWRVQNIIRAGKFSNEINHITGDVNFLLFGLRGKKNVLTIHDVGHIETLRKRNYLHYLIYKNFWYQLPLKYVSILTVVSGFTKDKVMEYFSFPEEKIRVIHDPIKPLFTFVKKEMIKGQPRILMMGTGKHKNLNNLIEAVKDTGYHLDIIGWPANDELEKLERYNISHTICNNLSDAEVNERYRACDVLFNASFYEGFGMPIIEAQSVGRPVVTSNIGAMKEIAGNSAVLADPHKPEEIKTAIKKLVNDKAYYDDVVERGRANTGQYQYKQIAQQYLEVYKELSRAPGANQRI